MCKDRLKNPHNLLDNPVWHSLRETHRAFARGNDHFKRYDPEVTPFGGVDPASDTSGFLNEYLDAGESMYFIGIAPSLPSNVVVENELICLQMVCQNPIDAATVEPFILLTEEHKKSLTDLVNQVQPGYFRSETKRTGDYFGIFKNDMLVAVTGERMKMDQYTEISAVVTHPDFTGRGYAKQLMAHTVNKNLSMNLVPYLHVAAHNTSAISLYEKLGFYTRKEIIVWKVRKTNALAMP